ncbi:MAG: DNA adenine methylase [Bacteroidales bacterium]|jgi:hypothetical protein|nr:DNA adenine methylase [Bacteroidales bacterium]
MKAKTNILPDSIEYKAAKYTIDSMLAIGTTEKDIVKTLNDRIGYGGGFTLNNDCHPYFMCHNSPGIKIRLTKRLTDGGLEEIIVPRNIALEIAKEIIEERKAAVKSKTTVQDIEFKDGDRVMLHNDKNLTGTIENDYDNDCDIVLVCMDDGRNLTPYKKSLTKIQEAQTEMSCGYPQTEKALSPGTKPYFDKYLNKNKEVCGGGLVFEIGKKPSCKECASSCSGCLEMAVNYGNANIENVYHLIERPEMLNKTNRKKFDSIAEKKNKIESTAKTDKNNCNRSSVYYPGQKNIEGVYQKIINEIPECKRFIELFAGTGAISKIVKKHAPETTVICNDINPEVAGKIKFTGEHVSALDAITYIKNNQDKLNSEDFVFLDPPYHPETRPNSLNLYKYELSAQDHEQLISSVLQLNCKVMIIHPGCDLYDDILIMDNGWRFVNLKIRYHNKTSEERLYMNYPVPKKLLITKFLGKDCWDRQRIKRKGDRMIAKLKALPAPELQYILEKINNEIKL